MNSDLPTLYCFPTSFYSQKALLALAEKGIPVNKHRINLGQFENYEGWFMKLNPKGQVPVLVDEDKVIPDSSAIIKYADDTYEGPVLMPDMGREKWADYQKRFEDVRVEILTFGSVVFPDMVEDSLIPPFLQSKMRDNVKQGKRSQQLEEMMTSNPSMTEVYKKKLEECAEMENSIANRETLISELNNVRDLLTQVNTDLTDRQQEWLCGPDITIADICLAILLHRLRLTGYAKQLWEDKKLPLISAYYDRLLYRKTFRDVCVDSVSKKNLLSYAFGDIIDWVPLVVSGLFLIVSIAVGYIVYQYL